VVAEVAPLWDASDDGGGLLQSSGGHHRTAKAVAPYCPFLPGPPSETKFPTRLNTYNNAKQSPLRSAIRVLENGLMEVPARDGLELWTSATGRLHVQLGDDMATQTNPSPSTLNNAPRAGRLDRLGDERRIESPLCTNSPRS
jgi:hypothetical protein